MTALAAAGAALLGGAPSRSEALGGGSLSQILRIHLADGRTAIVKGGPAPCAEAAMLRAIAASGAPAPAVLAVSGAALVLQELPGGGGLGGGGLGRAWGSLGAAAARLHSTCDAQYGWPEDYAFGAVAIPNGRADDWPAFWSERRLLPGLPHLPAPLARRIERLAAALPERLPARPAAALLHGDLWTGNVLADGDRVSGLIDPACYFGHAEVDLAMLRLFGRPGPAFDAAYGPLEPGHEARLPIYQLWPALVHLRLFGGGYAGMVERLLTAARV